MRHHGGGSWRKGPQDRLQAAGKRITLVDMHAALAPDDLLPDGVHPNRTGMEKIAAAGFMAIVGK